MTMPKLGFEPDSPLGELYRIVQARLRQQGQDESLLNQGVPGKDGKIENDPDQYEADELLHFTYSRSEYYPDLYRLGFPLPFVLDDFDPGTAEDDRAREQMAQIATGIKKSLSRKYPPRRKLKQFRTHFPKEFGEKKAALFPKFGPACPHLSVLEMIQKKDSCGTSFSTLFVLYAAYQAAGIADLWGAEIHSLPLNIPNWEKIVPDLEPWNREAFFSFSGEKTNDNYIGEPAKRAPYTPLRMTKIWLAQKTFQHIENKEWQEAERGAQLMQQIAPHRLLPWQALTKIYGLSGRLDSYQQTVLNFERHFADHADFAFVRAVMKLDRLQWEWGQGIWNEGEWVAVLKDLEELLNRQKGVSLEDYLSNCEDLGRRLWEFAQNIPAGENNVRPSRLKALMEWQAFQFLLKVIELKPDSVSHFGTAWKIALEKKGDFVEGLYQASQKLLQQDPDNDFYLYFALLVQAARADFHPSLIQPEEKELWKAELHRLETKNPLGETILPLFANSYSELEDNARAIQLFEQLYRTLAKNSPEVGRLHLVLAQKYDALGEQKKSEAHLHRVRQLIPAEHLHTLLSDLAKMPWDKMIDMEPSQLKKEIQKWDSIIVWLKGQGTDTSAMDQVGAQFTLVYLGTGETGQAEAFLKAWSSPEALLDHFFGQFNRVVVNKISQEASTPLRMAFLDNVLSGIQELHLARTPQQSFLHSSAHAVLLQEALYLKDEGRIKKTVDKIVATQEGFAFVSMMNAVHEFLQKHHKDPERRRVALLFFQALARHLPVLDPNFAAELIKTRIRDAAKLFAQAGDQANAKKLNQMGGGDGNP